MDTQKPPSLPLWVFTALAATVVILFSTGMWFYHAEKRSGRQQAEKQLDTVARLKMNQIIAWRTECLGDAAMFTENPFFRRGVTHLFTNPNSGNTEELRSFFNGLRTYRHYDNVLLADPQGKVYMNLNPRSNTDGYKEVVVEALRQRRPVFNDLHSESQGIAPHISVVAPIFSGPERDAPPLGVIVLIYDATRFIYPLIQSWPTPSTTAETLLVRRDGDSVLFLNPLRHRPDAALKLRISLDKTDMPAVMAVLGRQGLVEGLDYRGIKTVAIILPVPDSPWFIVSKDDAAVVFSGWRSRATLILAFFTALAGGLGAIGLFFWQRNQKAHYQALYKVETEHRVNVERHSIILQAVGDGIIATDAQGRIELINPIAEVLTGWLHRDACGKPLEEVFHIVNEKTRDKIENPVAKVLSEGKATGLADHTLLITQEGIERPIADSAAPFRNAQGEVMGVVLVFRDQTDERRMHRLIQTRITLMEYALVHTFDELLTKALDEIGALVDSPIGFYHFVDADQKNLLLQQWSTRTLNGFCKATGKGLHYGIDQAGVWADSVHAGKPVIHNDYASLPHKKGMPEGHALLVRELTVPVIRAGKVVAILGVGNKPTAYTDKDIEIVTYLSDVTWQLIEQKRADEDLHSSEMRYRRLYQSMMDAFIVTDMQGRIRECNKSFRSMLGYTEDELRQLSYRDLTPEKWYSIEEAIVKEHVLPNGKSGVYEKEYQRKDGTVLPVELRTFLIVNDEGKPEGLSAIVRDISERKIAEQEREKLQAQLNQAQKMESVGRLAGGVAHDFNNMLSVILGYAELALEKVEASDSLHHYLEAIYDAGKRSSDITRQLLAFARKQTIAPRVLDLNETVEGMLKMLRRLIGEDINLAWLPGAGLGPVNIDPSQMDQLLANLCVNSRDAIEGVGKITIETSQVTFDQMYCADHTGFIPGNFVRLAVSDDGCGMDREVLDKLFEPFFTTKKTGQGTGLGLATVYGIVKQNNGFINVYSEPGQGTTIKIYLPLYDGDSCEIETNKAKVTPEGHGETILIVEDEEAILKLSKRMLNGLGYTVFTASTPSEAMHLVNEHGHEIHLLITDVVMPEMNGRQLAEQLNTRCPDLKTLFMSGYTANVIAHRGILDEGVRFLHKPFSKKELAIKVREALQG